MSPTSKVQQDSTPNAVMWMEYMIEYSGLPDLFTSFSNSLKERSGGDTIPLVLKTCAEFLEQEGTWFVLESVSIYYRIARNFHGEKFRRESFSPENLSLYASLVVSGW